MRDEASISYLEMNIASTTTLARPIGNSCSPKKYHKFKFENYILWLPQSNLQRREFTLLRDILSNTALTTKFQE